MGDTMSEAVASMVGEPMQMAKNRRRYQPPEKMHHLTSSVLNALSDTAKLWAPPFFWAAGDVGLLSGDLHRVAIIGSRDASELAIKRSTKIARQLAESHVVVVSGLAKGIDRSAHESAIATGGHTIAVIGTPLDRCYPAEHAELQRSIYTNHLLVSQFENGARTFPSDFVKRNRFMALLCNATIVVEAGDTSGTLSQAAETQRLGKPLFIMKSVLDNKALSWPQKFLHPKSGLPAQLLEDVSQVLAVLGK
jgi:DNA processing protein